MATWGLLAPGRSDVGCFGRYTTMPSETVVNGQDAGPTVSGDRLPPESWEAFEEFCADLFALELDDPTTEKYGRRGQRQHGIDIYCAGARGGRTGIQCKNKRTWPPTRITTKEIDADVRRAMTFEPPLECLIVATTAPTDARVQDHVRLITERHVREGRFRVQVMGWDELVRRGRSHASIAARYFGSGLTPALAQEDLREYRAAAKDELARRATGFIPVECHHGTGSLSLADLRGHIREWRRTAIVGRSGTGKSMLANQLASEWIADGGVAVPIEARNFVASVEELIARELRLVSECTLEALELGLGDSPTSVMLVVDGVNECAPSASQDFLREAEYWAKRLTASLLVVQQNRDGLSNAFEVVEVAPPSMDAKLAIARAQQPLNEVPLDVLVSVESGLEASILGRLGSLIPAGAGRFRLLEAFLRQRLGPQAPAGLNCLASFARLLASRTAFSLPEREIERSFGGEVEAAMLQDLVMLGILEKRGHRLSFSHEMFLRTMAADWIVGLADEDLAGAIGLLGTPYLRPAAVYVLGAISDENMLREVFQATVDRDLLEECLNGFAGEETRLLANDLQAHALRKAKLEAATFEAIAGEGIWGVQAISRVGSWEPQERLGLRSLGGAIRAGQPIDDALEVLKVADARVLELAATASTSALGERDFTERLFGSVFVLDEALGVSRLVRSTHSDFVRVQADLPMISRLADPGLSNAELYVLLHLCRFTEARNAMAAILPEVIAFRWPAAPYHLRLDLAYAAEACAGAEESLRLVLVSTLEALPPTSDLGVASTITEALTRLGAFSTHEEQLAEQIRKEFGVAAARPDDPDHQAIILGSFLRQFDHPLDHVYCEEWEALEPRLCRTLLRMALAASPRYQRGFGFDLLLFRVLRLQMTECAPLVEHWTKVPEHDRMDEYDVFVAAHVALAGFGAELPDTEHREDGPRSLRACGEILYWANRTDLAVSERDIASSKAWAVLTRPTNRTAVDALARVEPRFTGPWADDGYVRSIRKAFLQPVSQICCRALRSLEAQESCFGRDTPFEGERRVRFVLAVVGDRGTRAELPALRSLALDGRWGSEALEAIREIELRHP